MYKKKIKLLLSTLLIFAILTACGNEPEKEAMQDEPKEVTTNEVEGEIEDSSSLEDYGADGWGISKFDWDGMQEAGDGDMEQSLEKANTVLSVSLNKYFGLHTEVVLSQPSPDQNFFNLDITNNSLLNETELKKFKENAEQMMLDAKNKIDIDSYMFTGSVRDVEKASDNKTMYFQTFVLDNGVVSAPTDGMYK
ncbi:hypothetical protein [Listeria rustica]|uniref:Lipoprotein n=1 Tax=Listeria rustica TaxID=2713503 RepID=A0A7W1YF09_9LIST|nr:hypothetical protein [Listeria rustica]MBA3925111.1 hypothetical protein [Listeria rustica]